MGSLSSILMQLEENYLAQNIWIPHDEARMAYRCRSNIVGTIEEFTGIVGDYYNYHYTRCVTGGGSLPPAEAEGKAKEIIEKKYRLGKDSFVAAFNDANRGTNGGLRNILDIIADYLKAESTRNHMRKVLDDEVRLNSWDDKVDIIRQFINHCGPDINQYLDQSQPERYAHNYEELIEAYVNMLQKTSSFLRRF